MMSHWVKLTVNTALLLGMGMQHSCFAPVQFPALPACPTDGWCRQHSCSAPDGMRLTRTLHPHALNGVLEPQWLLDRCHSATSYFSGLRFPAICRWLLQSSETTSSWAAQSSYPSRLICCGVLAGQELVSFISWTKGTQLWFGWMVQQSQTTIMNRSSAARQKPGPLVRGKERNKVLENPISLVLILGMCAGMKGLFHPLKSGALPQSQIYRLLLSQIALHVQEVRGKTLGPSYLRGLSWVPQTKLR